METISLSLSAVALTSLVAIPLIVYGIGWLAARATRRKNEPL
jgi:uncharacterized membrane protein HdeD (DUF308 family)